MRRRIGVVVFGCAIPLLGQTVRVPFVGCASDGQAGPVEAPKGSAVSVPIEAGTARRLAYYKASSGFGVLAPRGWNCFLLYGSDGSNLLVSPVNQDFTGPAVEVGSIFGQGSGVFELAQAIAAAFPARMASMREVIKEGKEAGMKFGPYAKDKLIVRSDSIVEYRTPANSEGLGTMGGLQTNTDPIAGVAILQGATPDLVFLGVRLPRELRTLAPIIIRQLEREGAKQAP